VLDCSYPNGGKKVAKRPVYKIVITLEEEDLLELQAVLLDADETAAIEFLKKRIAPKIPAKGPAACDASRCNPYLWKSDTAH
jgi:hypothetical protein